MNLLFMGRISKIKGVSDLLQAWEKEDTGNWEADTCRPLG